MVYSDVLLFDLSDSVEDGKSGERSARELVAVKFCLFYQVLYGYLKTLALK